MKTGNYSFIFAFLAIGAITLFSSCEENTAEQITPEKAGFLSVTEEGYTSISVTEMGDYFVSNENGLTQEEIEGIELMREEEKLARDVYETLYDQHELRIFNNIASSENTHFEAVGSLIDYFGLNDPASSEAGEFNNEELQSLYESLVSKGSESLVAGLEVGTAIEEIDILDLQELINGTDNEDLILVYENLLRGSRNHLRAFNRQLERNGVDYSPQYMDAGDFEQIISSDMERGGYGECDGEGIGQGQGNRNKRGEGAGDGTGFQGGNGGSGNGNGYQGGNGGN